MQGNIAKFFKKVSAEPNRENEQETIEDSYSSSFSSTESEEDSVQEESPKVGRLQLLKSAKHKPSGPTDISQGKLEGIVEISITVINIIIIIIIIISVLHLVINRINVYP